MRARQVESIARFELEALMSSRDEAHRALIGYDEDLEEDDESMDSDSDEDMEFMREETEPVDQADASAMGASGQRGKCLGPCGTELINDTWRPASIYTRDFPRQTLSVSRGLRAHSTEPVFN